MDRCVFDMLDHIAEGIVMLDDRLKICFWNTYMEDLLDIDRNEVMGVQIFEVFPKLNRPYFINTFNKSLEDGHPYFFSSKLHKNLIAEDLDINFKVNRMVDEGKIYLMIEFLDITNQCIRINQLKEYANELWALNKKLQEKEKEIERLAYYDILTNVGNRTLFYTVSEKFLASAKRNNSILGLMFIDIDRFKDINDEYGHGVGDKALVEVANILAQSTRESDVVTRYGGDEFMVLLPNLDCYNSYDVIADRIAKANKTMIIEEDIELNIRLSIGISFYPRDGNNIEELMLKADKAMYMSKQGGGDRCTQYISKN